MIKLVRKTSTGETFAEIPRSMWDVAYEGWQVDHSLPAPMVHGHKMFSAPADYGCVPLPPVENSVAQAHYRAAETGQPYPTGSTIPR